PGARSDDPRLRGPGRPHPPLGRRRDRLGLRPGGGDRGVLGEGAAAARARREPRARMNVLAVAVTGRGLVPVEEPVLRADDEALLRGRAVFETLRVYGGRPFKLAEHLDRLAFSASRLELDPPPREELESLSALALEHGGVQDAMLRLTWTPGGVGIALAAAVPAELEQVRDRGARLVSLAGPTGAAPWLLGGVK